MMQNNNMSDDDDDDDGGGGGDHDDYDDDADVSQTGLRCDDVIPERRLVFSVHITYSILYRRVLGTEIK